VFIGLGKMPGTYHIRPDRNIPPVSHAPRIILFALEERLKKTLQELEHLEVIKKQDQPTDWVNSLLIVEKKSIDLFASVWIQETLTELSKENITAFQHVRIL